jgi:hypothetical protein
LLFYYKVLNLKMKGSLNDNLKKGDEL